MSIVGRRHFGGALALACVLGASERVAHARELESVVGAEVGLLGSNKFFPVMPALAGRIGATYGVVALGAIVTGAHDVVGRGRTETFSSAYTGLWGHTELGSVLAAIQIGAHTVSALGPSPNGVPPSPMNVLLFAGLRFEAATYDRSGSRLGVALFFGRDLTHGSAVVEKTDCPITSLGCNGENVTIDVGGTTAGLAFNYAYPLGRW